MHATHACVHTHSCMLRTLAHACCMVVHHACACAIHLQNEKTNKFEVQKYRHYKAHPAESMSKEQLALYAFNEDLNNVNTVDNDPLRTPDVPGRFSEDSGDQPTYFDERKTPMTHAQTKTCEQRNCGLVSSYVTVYADATVRFWPIEILKFKNMFSSSSSITFTMFDAPPGFFIDVNTAEIIGTPRASRDPAGAMIQDAYNTTIYAVDPIGGSALVEAIRFTVLPHWTDTSHYAGPNNMPCANNGVPYDDIKFDGFYACDCSSTGFEGDNCMIVKKCGVDTALVSGQCLPFKIVFTNRSNYIFQDKGENAEEDAKEHDRLLLYKSDTVYTDPASMMDTYYAIGHTYAFERKYVDWSKSRITVAPDKVKAVSYELFGAPPGFFVRSETGEITGIFIASDHNTTWEFDLYVRDENAKVLVQQYRMNVRFRDIDNPTLFPEPLATTISESPWSAPFALKDAVLAKWDGEWYAGHVNSMFFCGDPSSSNSNCLHDNDRINVTFDAGGSRPDHVKGQTYTRTGTGYTLEDVKLDAYATFPDTNSPGIEELLKATACHNGGTPVELNASLNLLGVTTMDGTEFDEKYACNCIPPFVGDRCEDEVVCHADEMLQTPSLLLGSYETNAFGVVGRSKCIKFNLQIDKRNKRQEGKDHDNADYKSTRIDPTQYRPMNPAGAYWNVGEVYRIPPPKILDTATEYTAGDGSNISYELVVGVGLKNFYIDQKNGVVLGYFDGWNTSEKNQNYSYTVFVRDGGGAKATLEKVNMTVSYKDFEVYENSPPARLGNLSFAEYISLLIQTKALVNKTDLDQLQEPAPLPPSGAGSARRGVAPPPLPSSNSLTADAAHLPPQGPPPPKGGASGGGGPPPRRPPLGGAPPQVPPAGGPPAQPGSTDTEEKWQHPAFSRPQNNSTSFNGMPPCGHGVVNDTVPYDTVFECDCGSTLFRGPACTEQGPNEKLCSGGDLEIFDENGFDGKFTCNCLDGRSGENCETDATLLQSYLEWEKTKKMLPGVLVPIGLVAIIAVIGYRRWRYMLKMRPVSFEKVLATMLASGEIAPEQISEEKKPREIRRRNLTFVSRIGNGNFGEVWKCILDESRQSGIPEYGPHQCFLGSAASHLASNMLMCTSFMLTAVCYVLKPPRIPFCRYTVAAKTVLDAEESPGATKELLSESSVMAQVAGHPNLVSIVGVITRGDPLVLVIQFCEHGSLLSVLKTSAAAGNPVDLLDKVQYAVDVGKGVAHLTGLHFIHRDLASRNPPYPTGDYSLYYY